MQSHEIRSRFLTFFKNRGHVVIPSASLVTQDTGNGANATLFNIAGMQPLMPFLMGEKHPDGTRLADSQKCVRTVDLDEVGDATHLTFFEMLGNWSLGDYFKQDAIEWSWMFLTSKEEGLGLDPARLYVTVFGGSDAVERDLESVEIWKKLGMPEHRIYFKNSKSNWWSAGPNSPAGPSTEMFYDLTGTLGDMSQEEFEVAEDAQQVVEIWNDVFMMYRQENGQVAGELPARNVDTGAGLERVTTVVQGKSNIYDTDLFADVMEYIKSNQKTEDLKAARVISDHVRTSVFLITDGVHPSNKDRGYIVRRLLRRAIRFADMLGLPEEALASLVSMTINKYKGAYPELAAQESETVAVILDEERKFRGMLKDGLRQFEKGTDPFVLFTTYGFPIELTEELARERGTVIDREAFDQKLKEHQDQSRTSSAGTFKGGLANTNTETVKLHTAHHLLLAALQQVLGSSVKQRGSNITEERLRMDFIFDRKMTDEEKAEVERIVNEKIAEKLDVVRKEMPLSEAQALGAEMEFGAKYPEVVSVYFIQEKDGSHFSKEFCGGPHVSNTGELGSFKIQKEEAVSQGVRRIKAVLQ
jgi:alanyl-tRNA synthetase